MLSSLTCFHVHQRFILSAIYSCTTFLKAKLLSAFKMFLQISLILIIPGVYVDKFLRLLLMLSHLYVRLVYMSALLKYYTTQQTGMER